MPKIPAWAVLALALCAPAIAEPLPLPPSPTAAAVAPAESLRAAVEQAWARAPAARALGARIEQAEAAAAVAGAWTAGPASVGAGVLNDRLNRRAGNQELEAELGVPLWLPGQRAAQLAVAQAQRRLLEDDTAARRLLLAGEVREAWWALAAARETVALQHERVEAARALRDDVARRVRAGELARTDANTANVELQAAEAERAGAQQAERVAALRLQALTGRAAPAALPPESAPPDSAEVDDSHPRLAAAMAAVRQAHARLPVAELAARGTPELSLRLRRERADGQEPYANTVGVRLRVPLSSEPRRLRDTAEVRADLLELEAGAAQQRAQLALELQAAHAELATAQARATLAAQRAALAADTLALIHKSFALGESDLPTLLRVRAADLDARAEARRQAVALDAARSRIRHALGLLP